MTENFSFKIMLADGGGMLVADEGRYASSNDKDLAAEIGRWVLEALKQTCVDNARITVTIDTQTE